MAKKQFKTVEWLDEHLMGHTTGAYQEGDQVFVEVRVSGSVELDGKEYILNEVLTVAVEKCNIHP